MQEQVDAHNFIKSKNRQLWRNYELRDGADAQTVLYSVHRPALQGQCHEIFASQGAPPVSTEPAGKFATSTAVIVDTVCKFVTAVIDTVDKFSTGGK